MGNFDLNSGLSPPSAGWQFSLTSPAMKSLSRVFAHILATIAKVLTIGGAKAVLGELTIRHLQDQVFSPGEIGLIRGISG